MKTPQMLVSVWSKWNSHIEGENTQKEQSDSFNKAKHACTTLPKNPISEHLPHRNENVFI